MSESRTSKWFVDEGTGLDRFGFVLGLSILSVTLLSLIDLDDVGSGIRAEIGWVIVTLSVGLTLIASLRASGVARRPRRFVEIFLFVWVAASLAILALSEISGGAIPGFDTAQPSILWTVVAAATPILVLRRVMRQATVTLATLEGAVAVYLLTALAFNYAFLAVDNASGGFPFFGSVESTSSYMYYSLSTITTVGYGDLAAVGDIGRFLSSAEAVIGQVLLVTVVARLVTMYARTSERVAGSGGQSSSATVE